MESADAGFVLQLCVCADSRFFPIGESELAVGDFDRGQGGEFWNFPDRRSFGIFDEKKVGSRIFIISSRWSMYFLFFFASMFQLFHVFPFSADVGMLELRKDGAVR